MQPDNALHLQTRLPSHFLQSQQPRPTLGIKLAWKLGGAVEHMSKIADLSEAEIRALKRVGFWVSEEAPDLPDPADSIDTAWRKAEGDRILSYVDQAYGLPYAYAGFSWCRLGCPGVPSDIGTQDRTDGTFLFPEGLAHYIREHSVRPPAEFIEHVRSNHYVLPRLPELSV